MQRRKGDTETKPVVFKREKGLSFIASFLHFPSFTSFFSCVQAILTPTTHISCFLTPFIIAFKILHSLSASNFFALPHFPLHSHRSKPSINLNIDLHCPCLDYFPICCFRRFQRFQLYKNLYLVVSDSFNWFSLS